MAAIGALEPSGGHRLGACSCPEAVIHVALMGRPSWVELWFAHANAARLGQKAARANAGIPCYARRSRHPRAPGMRSTPLASAVAIMAIAMLSRVTLGSR